MESWCFRHERRPLAPWLRRGWSLFKRLCGAGFRSHPVLEIQPGDLCPIDQMTQTQGAPSDAGFGWRTGRSTAEVIGDVMSAHLRCNPAPQAHELPPGATGRVFCLPRAPIFLPPLPRGFLHARRDCKSEEHGCVNQPFVWGGKEPVEGG